MYVVFMFLIGGILVSMWCLCFCVMCIWKGVSLGLAFLIKLSNSYGILF